MKRIAALVTLLVAACCSAADLSPKLLRLIGDDARMVTGADLGRQRDSVLEQFLRSGVTPDADTRPTYQVLWIERGSANSPATLTVVMGAAPSKVPDEPDEFTALDAITRVAGDPESIAEAQRRWTVEQPLSLMAAKVRRLAQSYDNWFLLVKPFSAAAGTQGAVSGEAAPVRKYRQELIEAVEEISGGIRFGSINELHLEAVFRSPEDASAVATLARWLPGILQVQGSDSPVSVLVDAVENFTVHADGQRASISLWIPEEKARALIEARKARQVVE